MIREDDNLILESDYLFENFFEISLDLLCIIGFDGYFKRVNSAVCNLLGYTQEELYSKHLDEFIYYEDQKRTADNRIELHKNKPLRNFENRYVTKKGDVIWLSWNSIPKDNQKLIYAVAKDVTHSKKLEEERNLLLANFTKMNNHLKKISYTSSHNLRSPVSNLISILDLLDVSKITDCETLQFIEMLKTTTERLKLTLNDYVNTLISEDQNIVQIQELNLEETLNTVLLSINHIITQSKTMINVDFSLLSEVNFNKIYLESVFLNLITNSIKYCKPNELPVISISTRINDGIKQIIFSDNGIGFDMNHVKDKIFGLHQKFNDHVDSKGIGLYLVYNHITGLGGTITVESKIDVGTKFIISFKK